MSSEEFRVFSMNEFREECFLMLDNRLGKIRKFHMDCEWVKRPPMEKDYTRLKNLKAAIKSNYDFLSDVLRFLGELQVLTNEELNKYLYYLDDVEKYVDVI